MAIGIYIHIPFCKAKCRYCDFNSYPGMESAFADYTDAVCREIENFRGETIADTVYFGGGTPTVLPADLLKKIMEAVKRRFRLTDDCEITVECNPGTVGEEELQKLREIGVNRLSIGAQSDRDDVLKYLGRIHTAEELEQCLKSARKVGFENISLDYMYGLPKQSVSDWQKTLSAAVSYHPEHISIYALKVEENTPLFDENPTLPEDDTVRDCYDAGVAFLRKSGYTRYEISNFAKEGRESRHNNKYWNCDDYIGFGAGAHSCVEGKRFFNLCGISEYCRAILQKGNAKQEEDVLSGKEQMSEFCFLGLRREKGISRKEFAARFGMEILEVFGESIEKNIRRGTLLMSDDNIYIPDEWLFVSNQILADFV